MSDKPTFKSEVIDKSHQKPVVVDFWAPWCGPCRTLGPVLEKLAHEAGGTWRLVKINADHHPDLVREYGIRGIPAVKMFIDGRVAADFVGSLPERAVKDWLAQHVPAKEEGEKASAAEA
jgi:putative thioredoxin